LREIHRRGQCRLTDAHIGLQIAEHVISRGTEGARAG
jgi:hypothetical protein